MRTVTLDDICDSVNPADAEAIISAANNYAPTAKALQDLLEIVNWLGDSGNLKSPIEPHPYGLGVAQAKLNARQVLLARQSNAGAGRKEGQ